MTDINPELNHQEIKSLQSTNERFEKILEKLTDSNSQIILLIQEVKSTNDNQTKRMDYMESEARRVEDQRSKERQILGETLKGVYKKIDDTENKNESKIDQSMGTLSTKIDQMADSYYVKLEGLSEKIDKLEILKYVTFGAWLVVGAVLAKFNILGTIFASMSIGH